MRKILFLGVFLICNIVSAQNIAKIIPPSPTAAELGRAGLAVPNLVTGELRTEIPLYTLTTPHLKLPVSLSYSASGLKIDAVASREGLGWLLNAGGMINRMILGKADDYTNKLQVPADFPSTKGCTATNFVNAAIQDGYDTQADIFTFSFMGYSGQFFIDDNEQIQKLEQNNLLITNNGYGSFEVTAPDGVQYFFDAVETSRSVNNCSGNQFDRNMYKNAWFLTRIVHPDDDVISIKYANCHVIYESGINQSFNGLNTIGSACDQPTQRFVSCETVNTNDGVYPVEISSNSGGLIKLLYDDRQDLRGDKCLSKMVIYDATAPKAIKAYSFIYDYSNKSSTDAIDKRLFLMKVVQTPDEVTSSPSKEYSFDYGSISSLPPRLSYSQDYMGFYNGKFNPTMISKPVDQQWVNLFQSYGFGDRSPAWQYSQMGMLQKLTYPTGGYDQITYEPHLILSDNRFPPDEIKPNAYLRFDGEGGDIFKRSSEDQYSNVVVVNNDHIGSVSVICHPKDGIEVYPEDSKYYYIKFVLLEDGNAIIDERVDLNVPFLKEDVQLKAGKSYQFRITHFSQVNSHSELHYYDAPVIINREIPGVRVKKIVSVNNVGPATEKNFFYTTLGEPTKSCGIAYNQFPYNKTNYTNHVLVSGGGLGSCVYNECSYVRFNSGSFYDLFSYDGKHIYYPTVLESDKADLSNGLIEHQYWVEQDVNANLISGDQIMNGPLSNTSVGINGKEALTNYYKMINGNRVLIKQVNNNWIYDPRLRRSKTFFSLVATGAGASLCSSCNSTTGSLSDFQNVTCLSYEFRSEWVYNDKITTKEFDENGNLSLTTIQENKYDNTMHQLPTQVTTYTSKGGTLTKMAKYPQDVINENPTHLNNAGATVADWEGINSLVNKNMIDVPVEQITIRDGKQTEDLVNLYRVNPANGVPHLATVNISKLNYPFEKRYEVLNYNAAGNILEQRKAAGETNSYIWDYQNRYPVAEAVNASTAEIAYTGFESDGTGGWAVSGSQRNTSGSITGNKSYDLSNGAITKSGLDQNATYIVSYWNTQNAAFNISGTQVNVVRGKTINGWTYFEHKVSGVTQVVIPGNGGLIDELRLYPAGSLMTTYAYAPMIGMTSQCDGRNKITNYEYDGLNRLLRVRDEDKNILKQYDYQYQIYPTRVPLWQRTGATRCTPCSDNIHTTYCMQAEEKDGNPNSPLYNTTQWVNVPGGNCTPQPDWQNTTTPVRCKNTNGINSGEQEQEQEDKNPCSNQGKRWIVIATNTTACPVCNTGNCYGIDHKCINNQCEVGRKVYYEKIQIDVHVWQCYYGYEFSDGTTSGALEEITTSPLGCPIVN
ncbi:hypothetical protein A4H97_19510 [Niastella yeongjuensis]|uniref:YD repeat-containing protein n=1 Tax=Niastella yeongjuensis TaxID=354355 RepID=A0A1V9DYE0_9BACT|nr:hypothetical protein [Niastella yeongjuensis]OQP38893.1 hypothetical protein A4H97_19510 [Niastella yeongjuensis]SEO28728.1 hypothetical protein SAMN05660816_02499 [Niastella yeongjuensis]